MSERWGLASEMRWSLDVDRAPLPGNEPVIPDFDNPQCSWFWCHKVWRSPIAEDAAIGQGRFRTP